MSGIMKALAASDERKAGPLSEIRHSARRRVEAQGLPTRRQEGWKYTDLRALDAISYRAAQAGDADSFSRENLESLLSPDDASRLVVFVNGFLRKDLSELETDEDDVRIRGLAALANEAPASLAALFAATDEAPAFTNLNEALFEDGVLVELGDGAVARPLHIVSVSTGPDALLANLRVIVRAGRNAKLRIIEDYHGQEPTRSLTNVVTTLELAQGASVEHHRLQQEPTTSAHIGRVVATLAADAALHSDSVVFGGALTRVDIDAALTGRGAHVRLNGLFATRGEQHVDHHTTVDHQVGDTTSDELYRGILDERSRGVFNGKVIVRPDAQRINAKQASNNLLLSRQAEIDTKPELEIYADDVSCAHGATVGELDQAALFYLRSRGVSEGRARDLLTYAFASEVIKAIPLQSLRHTVARRFLGEAAAVELATLLSTI